LRDAVELEFAGIPTACVVHTEMNGSARAIARISGVEDYEFLSVGYPHIPTAIWSPEEIQLIADAITPQIRELLLKQLAPAEPALAQV
jgi:hypothetical protein